MNPEDGVRVLETGMAVVHQGETILPEAGSQARLGAPGGAETGSGTGSDTYSDTAIHYHFPVHIVVTGGLPDSLRAEIQDDLLERLYRALG